MITEQKIINMLYGMIIDNDSNPDYYNNHNNHNNVKNFARDCKDNLMSDTTYVSCEMTDDCKLLSSLKLMEKYELGKLVRWEILDSPQGWENNVDDEVGVCHFTLSTKAITLLDFKRL